MGHLMANGSPGLLLGEFCTEDSSSFIGKIESFLSLFAFRLFVCGKLVMVYFVWQGTVCALEGRDWH